MSIKSALLMSYPNTTGSCDAYDIRTMRFTYEVVSTAAYGLDFVLQESKSKDSLSTSSRSNGAGSIEDEGSLRHPIPIMDL